MVDMVGKNNPGLEDVLGAKGLIFPEEFMKKLGIDVCQLCILKDIYRQNASSEIADFSKFLKNPSSERLDLWKRATSYFARTQPWGLTSQHYMGVALGMKPKIWSKYWKTGNPKDIVDLTDYGLAKKDGSYHLTRQCKECYCLSREGNQYHLDNSSKGKRRSRGFYPHAEKEIVLSFLKKNLSSNPKNIRLILSSSIPFKIVNGINELYMGNENIDVVCNEDDD